jgi:hypothetical protein
VPKKRDVTRLLRAILTALVVAPLGAFALHAAQAATVTMHFTANENGAFAATHSLGFNLHDTGPTKAEVDGLPGGDRAVVWLGEKCPTGVSQTLTSAVAALAGDSRVAAYYLSDEPHEASCPQGAANLAAEADYIHAHARGQLAFIVLLDTGNDYSTFAPAHTHVDAVGLDPYPCNVKLGDCDYSHIADQVHQAESAGIAASVIVPTFQAFGDSYYLMPSPAQLQSILNEWATLVPHPVFDYTYSWGCQGGSLSSCLSSSPGDQHVMAAHNGGSSPAAPPTSAAPAKKAPAKNAPANPPSSSTAPSTTAGSLPVRPKDGHDRSPAARHTASIVAAPATGSPPAAETSTAAPATTATTDPTGSPLNHADHPHPHVPNWHLHRTVKHHHLGWEKRIALAFFLLAP